MLHFKLSSINCSPWQFCEAAIAFAQKKEKKCFTIQSKSWMMEYFILIPLGLSKSGKSTKSKMIYLHIIVWCVKGL